MIDFKYKKYYYDVTNQISYNIFFKFKNSKNYFRISHGEGIDFILKIMTFKFVKNKTNSSMYNYATNCIKIC
jgi:hypothetical protein